jgi:hypothetical protein
MDASHRRKKISSPFPDIERLNARHFIVLLSIGAQQ